MPSTIGSAFFGAGAGLFVVRELTSRWPQLPAGTSVAVCVALVIPALLALARVVRQVRSRLKHPSLDAVPAPLITPPR